VSNIAYRGIKMPHDELEEIKRYLVMWGDWQAAIECYRSSLSDAEDYGTSDFDPDIAERVERCMCELKHRHPNLYWPLHYCYLRQYSATEAAIKLKISKTIYKDRKKNGEHWVDAVYFSKIFKKTG